LFLGMEMSSGDLCCDEEAAREAAERELKPKRLRGEHYDLPVDVSVYAWVAAPMQELGRLPEALDHVLDEAERLTFGH
jgi:hypothetical protein